MTEFEWSHGSAEVVETAAMLRWAAFRLDGPERWATRLVRPFAPTVDAHGAGVPGHVRVLGGDFVGLPFGSAPGPVDPAPGWEGFAGVDPQVPPHGDAAEHDWVLVEERRDGVTLALDLPEPSPVARIERSIDGEDGAPALRFETVVHARRATRLPVGLHPIVRLPDPEEPLRLSVSFAEGFTYPGRVGDGTGVALPGASFTDLAAVPAIDGSTLDLTELPIGPVVDDVVQLTGARSPVALTYRDEGYAVSLAWDDELLPSLLLWISDRGIADEPWGGRYRGLGIEPIASAFDLPPSVSTAENPLARAGVPTAVELDPAAPLRIRSSVSVSALGAAGDGADGDTHRTAGTRRARERRRVNA